MKFFRRVFWVILLVMVAIACKEDPLEDVVSNDRQFLTFKIPGQVGPAVIQSIGADSGVVNVFAIIPSENLDLNSVQPDFVVSNSANATPAIGEAVSFQNEDRTAVYQVISESGQMRNWTVKILPYESTIEGVWKLKNALVYDWHIGIREDWGWGVFGAYDASTDSYDPANYVPELLSKDLPDAALETDNAIEFKTTRINENGNPEGTFSYSSGEDGKYASFILDPDRNGMATSYSKRYRQLPEGDGVWEFNESGKILKLWKKVKTGVETKAIVSVGDKGSIRLDFDIWIDEFTWDHWEAESHLESGLNLYYDLEK